MGTGMHVFCPMTTKWRDILELKSMFQLSFIFQIQISNHLTWAEQYRGDVTLANTNEYLCLIQFKASMGCWAHNIYNQLDGKFENYLFRKNQGVSTQIKCLRLINSHQGSYNVSKLIVMFPSKHWCFQVNDDVSKLIVMFPS